MIISVATYCWCEVLVFWKRERKKYKKQQQQQGQDQVQENKLSLGAPAISRGISLQLAQPTPVSGIQANALNSSSNNQCMMLYILLVFFLCLRDYSEILGTY